jgi:hypothetical protein
MNGGTSLIKMTIWKEKVLVIIGYQSMVTVSEAEATPRSFAVAGVINLIQLFL